MFIYSRIMGKTRKHQNRLNLNFWRAVYKGSMGQWVTRYFTRKVDLFQLFYIFATSNKAFNTIYIGTVLETAWDNSPVDRRNLLIYSFQHIIHQI